MGDPDWETVEGVFGQLVVVDLSLRGGHVEHVTGLGFVDSGEEISLSINQIQTFERRTETLGFQTLCSGFENLASREKSH